MGIPFLPLRSWFDLWHASLQRVWVILSLACIGLILRRLDSQEFLQVLSLDTSVTKEVKTHVFSIAIKKAKEFENFKARIF